MTKEYTNIYINNKLHAYLSDADIVEINLTAAIIFQLNIV